MLSHVISELIHCSPYMDGVFDMSRKLCSSHGNTEPCEPVDIGNICPGNGLDIYGKFFGNVH
jgi:hypothetical protein